ncbi:MAG: CBS domain-containing protein [Aquificae bacterium]|nr:CBS domain-containing protein [Aquificota bacterium]
MFRRFVLVPALVGLLVGFSAVVFVESLELVTELVLGKLVGYYPPLPAGEGERPFFTPYPLHPYLLPLTVALGGLFSGLVARYLAPESAGVGTDKAIRAYHYGEPLSLRSSLAKLVSSAVTIGTGGTSGREGPIALIGAGLGSFLAQKLKLGEYERRQALAVGLGAGVAAVFRAPLAGAVISGEVFFKKDFNVEAMVPGFFASAVSYAVFGSFYGFSPIFELEVPPFKEEGLLSLAAFAGLGVVCALGARLLVELFLRTSAFFASLPLPPVVKPAVGGLLAGAVGALFPPAIGNGYGWLQLVMDGVIKEPLFTLLSALAVVLGVSLTVGSGGSGGVFGPSVMAGGLLGASYALSLNELLGLSLDVPSFTVVGMVALFAGAAKAPLSTIILVAEMTGGYELLLPSMLAVFITYFLSGEKSIFPSQLDTRADSPAHAEEFGLHVLELLRVEDYMSKNLFTVEPETSVKEALELMAKKLVGGLPVVKDGKLVGIVTRGDLTKVPEELRRRLKVSQVCTREVVTVSPKATLAEVLRVMTARGIGRLPVVKDGKLVGIIARADLGRAVREHARRRTA